MALDALTHRKGPSWWQRFQTSPYQTMAKTLYTQRQYLLVDQEIASGITVVCISDTHNSQPMLPPGDILIHAGDLSQSGSAEEVQSQLDWLNAQPHLHKVVIAGNHDIVLDDQKSAELGFSPDSRRSLRWGAVIYLERSAVSLKLSSGRNVTVFGHPFTRKHGNWAFQFDEGTDKFTHQVSDDADILVTHCAPQFHLDIAGWGDRYLLEELWRVKPKLHVFGHLHEGHGRETLVYDRFEYLYEGVRAGSFGILALTQMVLLLLCHFLSTDSETPVKRSTLINASAVGGLLDQMSRKAQVVRI